MATLTAWKFERPDGASQAVRTLKELQRRGPDRIQERGHRRVAGGQKKPKTRQVDDMTGRWR